MSKAKLLSAVVALAGLLTTPAWAVGSDVARYPAIDGPGTAIVKEEHGVGILDQQHVLFSRRALPASRNWSRPISGSHRKRSHEDRLPTFQRRM
jgi:hypothetical protein